MSLVLGIPAKMPHSYPRSDNKSVSKATRDRPRFSCFTRVSTQIEVKGQLSNILMRVGAGFTDNIRKRQISSINPPRGDATTDR